MHVGLGGLFLVGLSRYNTMQYLLPEILWWWTWVGIMVTIGITWLLLLATWRFLIRRNRSRLASLLIITVITFMYLDTLGTVMGWYGGYTRYDQAVHFFGGMASALWLYCLLPRRWAAISAIVLAVTVAILFEYGELLVDQAFKVEYWLGDMPDTYSDVGFGFIGAITAIVGVHLLREDSKRKRQP